MAVWHMRDLKDAAGKNALKVVGAVTLNVPLTGKDRAELLAAGSDGMVAQFDGGYLDAGQGTDGMLNLTGSAFTLSVRLRSPSSVWGKPIFSKHGGHDRLVYNLFSFPTAIGFELGTRDTPGMTQVMAPLAQIGPKEWHTVVCRYDGKTLRMIVDGVVMDEANPVGPLRTGNTEPVLIGAETNGGTVNSGWQGQIDYVALWNRALSDAEIERLSGRLRTGRAAQKTVSGDTLAAHTERSRMRKNTVLSFTLPLASGPCISSTPVCAKRAGSTMSTVSSISTVRTICSHSGGQGAGSDAVSKDLIHWTEVQPAFWDDHRFGTGVQSGGCVYDIDNTSGLAHDKKHPPLIAFWSGFDNRSQYALLQSGSGPYLDQIRRNPYMIQPERDPKGLLVCAGQALDHGALLRRYTMIFSHRTTC